MSNSKKIEWILKIGVAGEFFGHGVFALQGKAQWIAWVESLSGMSTSFATMFMFVVGIVDIALALLVLYKPIKVAVLWMAFWGFWTALVRPLVGEPIWDFIERSANWALPLVMFYYYQSNGWPRIGRS